MWFSEKIGQIVGWRSLSLGIGTSPLPREILNPSLLTSLWVSTDTTFLIVHSFICFVYYLLFFNLKNEISFYYVSIIKFEWFWLIVDYSIIRFCDRARRFYQLSESVRV